VVDPNESRLIESVKLDEMDIGKLRQYASHLRVAVPKTAKKEDIIAAIKSKLSGRTAVKLAEEGSKLKPGYARIKVLSDPMPGAANSPVFVNANGYTCTIPRDVEVVVPQRVVRVLNDAVVKRLKQTTTTDNYGREVTRDTVVIQPSYPFQVLEMAPGEEPLTNLEISKLKTAGPKRRYRAMFGRWPRPKELARAIEQGLITLDIKEEDVGRDTESVMGLDE
jgi:hypothetical protein